MWDFANARITSNAESDGDSAAAGIQGGAFRFTVCDGQSQRFVEKGGGTKAAAPFSSTQRGALRWSFLIILIRLLKEFRMAVGQ